MADISTARWLEEDEGWLIYSKWAQRHLMNGLNVDEAHLFGQGLAYGYEAATSLRHQQEASKGEND